MQTRNQLNDGLSECHAVVLACAPLHTVTARILDTLAANGATVKGPATASRRRKKRTPAPLLREGPPPTQNPEAPKGPARHDGAGRERSAAGSRPAETRRRSLALRPDRVAGGLLTSNGGHETRTTTR